MIGKIQEFGARLDEKVKNQDRFGENVRLNFNKNATFKTTLGGVLTIFTYTVMFIGLCLKLYLNKRFEKDQLTQLLQRFPRDNPVPPARLMDDGE